MPGRFSGIRCPKATDSAFACAPGGAVMLTYIAHCCREWIMAAGYPVGACGLCGERPTYLRPDEREVA